MQEISEKKRQFLESIGISLDNLPPEFTRYSKKIEDVYSRDEIAFLSDSYITERATKKFCIKDIMGTIRSDYADRTWLEAFLASKRGDVAVEKFFRNPEYYTVDLKQMDQSTASHDSPIELAESNGQFFIMGGNNRMSLTMMRYLAEISKAQTAQERASIDEKYTFVGQIQATPKDKDIMYMINMMKAQYKVHGEDLEIRRTREDDSDCMYIAQLGEETIKIKDKEDLKSLYIRSYKLEGLENKSKLQDNLELLMYDREIAIAKENQGRLKVIDEVFPELKRFQECLVRLRKYGMNLETQIYEGVDLKNVNLANLCDRAEQLIEENEKKQEETVKNEKPQSPMEKKDDGIGKQKTTIEGQTQSVSNSIHTRYEELKQEEKDLADFAQTLGLSYSTTQIADTDIPQSINQIQENMNIICQKIQQIDDIEQLNGIGISLEKLEGLTQNGKNSEISQAKESFQKSFNKKIKDLIKDSKISNLKEEKQQVESQKIGILGRLLGKNKLKQVKLDNIDLKMDLMSKEEVGEKVTLEESLAELYAYSQNELGKKMTPEMRTFLEAIRSTPQLVGMIDKEKLKQLVEEKVQAQTQLPTVIGNERQTTRSDIKRLQEENEKLGEQIKQQTYARDGKRKFDETIQVTSSSLSSFQTILSQTLTQTKQIARGDEQPTRKETDMQIT